MASNSSTTISGCTIIREKQQAEELAKQMPGFIKRASEVAEEMEKEEEKKQAQ